MESGRHPPPSETSLVRLTGDLDRWGSLFLQIARTKDGPALERALGGLVEWMGNDLLQGWLYLPIPLFEEVSRLSEELFRACEAYLAWTRRVPRPLPADGRQPYEETIRGVLARAQALAEARCGKRGGGVDWREA